MFIQGHWKHSITVGMDGAPAGNIITGDYSPIAPDSSDGMGSLAYVVVQIAPGTPRGHYRINMWMDDGTTRQSVPVIMVVDNDCGGY